MIADGAQAPSAFACCILQYISRTRRPTMQTLRRRPAASFLLLLLMPCILSAPRVRAETLQPYTPTNDAVVLEHLPSTSDPRVRQFDVLKQQVKSPSHKPSADIALAQAYLDYGRETGDARYLGRAEAVIAPLVAQRPPLLNALLVEATILQSRHEFVESRVVLQAILARDSDNPQAWLTLASVAMVQGDLDEAHRDCGRLMGGMDALVVAGCLAAWSSANGHADNALRVLDLILHQEPNEPAAMQSWAHGLMADAAKTLGQVDRADAEFAKALQFAPGDNFLLADYADFLLDHGRPQRALELTRDYAQSDTSYLRQVLAESTLGLPATKADILQMASRFHDLEQRGDSRLYGREEARFALQLQNDPTKALRLAQQDWAHPRAPEDMRVYLEAALAAGQPQAAQPVLDFMQKTHLEDPVVLALAKRATAGATSHATAATGTSR
jgi:Tfp pilus assembly protein PilF